MRFVTLGLSSLKRSLARTTRYAFCTSLGEFALFGTREPGGTLTRAKRVLPRCEVLIKVDALEPLATV